MKSNWLRIILPLFTGIAVLAASPAVFAADEMLTDIPLKWTLKPKDEAMPPLELGANANKTFRIDAFTDSRANPKLIGENREKATRTVTTKDDVAPFATVHIKGLLAGAGLKFSDGDADYVITGELTDFFCLETNTYRANVGYKMTITGKNKKVLWTGTTSDHSSRFGRSYKADTYLDALDNALAGATKKLIQENDSFRNALRGG
jgi:hypothetical protein